jgi:hypothetical protein
MSRRRFLETSSAASLGALLPSTTRGAMPGARERFLSLCERLLETWCEGLLRYQVRDLPDPALHGGLLSPAEARIPGRCGDAVYPFLYLADVRRDARFLEAAKLVVTWTERNLGYADGSWANDVAVSSWRGITVFGAVAMAEALVHHGRVLDPETRGRWTERLGEAGRYLYRTIDIDFGNINYPATCSYALALLGRLLGEASFVARGRELAHEVLDSFTPRDRLLFGEGHPRWKRSPKGCLPVDVGYNVEESLPALTLYGLLEKDEEVLEVVTASLRSHVELLLPDGGWDNSWGTRNFKWTYWGSRTSDGSQPALALLSDREPLFLEAALRNTQLLERCTHEGILYGGPHYRSAGEPASLHHAFCHAKALATVLDRGVPAATVPPGAHLPREREKGVVELLDVQTWLVSVGPWRATVTGYDSEYDFPNGHASGGALSILWHEATGPLLTASMTEYRLPEPNNMQTNRDPHAMSLTPRVEMEEAGHAYRNISDLTAEVTWERNEGNVVFRTRSRLVDGGQRGPSSGSVPCQVVYRFTPPSVVVEARVGATAGRGAPRFILPVVADTSAHLTRESETTILIHRPDATIRLRSTAPLRVMPTTAGRVFNHVPGYQAIPLAVDALPSTVEMSIVGCQALPSV